MVLLTTCLSTFDSGCEFILLWSACSQTDGPIMGFDRKGQNRVGSDRRQKTSDEAGSFEAAARSDQQKGKDSQKVRGRPSECVNKVDAAVNPSSTQSCFFFNLWAFGTYRKHIRL